MKTLKAEKVTKKYTVDDEADSFSDDDEDYQWLFDYIIMKNKARNK